MRNIKPSSPSLEAWASSSRNGHPAITLDGAGKRYEAVEALRPVRLEIHRGETVAILGPSGSGKTTLLSLIAAELIPSAGTVHLNGSALASLRPGRELARQVGMIHQQFDLVPNLSALQNVLAGRLGQWSLARSLFSLVWPQERAVGLAALERVGVLERANVRAGRLSGGEQQRVAIARLLVQNPEIVLADEPVSSLDPARADEVLNILIETAQEADRTLVASIHSVHLARDRFSRLVGLRNGAVRFDRPSDQVTDEMIASLYDLGGLRAEV